MEGFRVTAPDLVGDTDQHTVQERQHYLKIINYVKYRTFRICVILRLKRFLGIFWGGEGDPPPLEVEGGVDVPSPFLRRCGKIRITKRALFERLESHL